jgi:hypothetical protein
MTYELLKLLHILLAIISVGFTSTFGIIAATATPATLTTALGIIMRLEKITRVGFAGLVITGLMMGGVAGYGLRPLWFSGSFVISMVSMGLAIAIATPTLRAMTSAAAQTPPPGDELRRLGGRSRAVGMVLTFLSLTMIVLMVLKPG